LEHTENLRSVRRTVNPDRDRDAQAILEAQEAQEVQEVQEVQEALGVQEVLERHGSQTGTVLASSPGPTMFRSGALPVNGLELVVGRRRLCGDLSPESALAILQKPPPDAVWTHDQTHVITSIFGPSDGTNFLERHYLKAQENSTGHL
jgi:hypothetical protein